MKKKLVIALVVGFVLFMILLLLLFIFGELSFIIYILMLLFIIGYGFYLRSLIGPESETTLPVKPTEPVLNKKTVVNVPIIPVKKVIIKKPLPVKGPLQTVFRSIKKKVGIIDKALDEYIKYNLYYGRSKKEIIDKLEKSGWNSKNVEQAFERVGKVNPIMVTKGKLTPEEEAIKERIAKTNYIDSNYGNKEAKKLKKDKK